VRNRLAALLLVLIVAAQSHAQRTGPATPPQLWKADLDESAALLQAGEYEHSLKISERVIQEMIDKLGPGDGAMRIFGIAVSQKALAFAGLDRKDDALWYWHTVLTLYPAFAGSDLSKFGDAGAFLAANRDPRQQIDTYKDFNKNAFRPPTVLKKVMPQYPAGARAFGVGGKLVVRVVITPAGTVSGPVVREALPAPTLSYVALEAVRQWRFIPPMYFGKPIPVQFDLTVNFKP
jgi:TonB family protein